MTIDLAQYAVLIVCLGLASVIGAVAGVSTIVKNIALTRAAKDPARVPPIGEELAKVYATKSEVRDLRDDIGRTCRANHERVAKTDAEIFSLIRSTQKDVLAALSDLTRNVSDWQRGIERQIGNIEGRIRK